MLNFILRKKRKTLEKIQFCCDQNITDLPKTLLLVSIHKIHQYFALKIVLVHKRISFCRSNVLMQNGCFWLWYQTMCTLLNYRISSMISSMLMQYFHVIILTSLSYQFATLNTGLAESIAVSSSV